MKNSPRRGALLAAVLGVSIALTGCSNNLTGGDEETAAPEGPIVIASTVDQTSYLKTVDERVLEGMQSAIKAINADGGILGREVILSVEDMAADPQRQVQAFQKLVTAEGTAAFANGFSSAGNAAIDPLATDAKVSAIVASVIPADTQWLFSTITPPAIESSIRVAYAEELGAQRVAIIHDPTPYAKVQVEVMTQQLDDAGIELTGVEEHASDVVDLRPQISKLLEGNPDLIMKISAGPSQIIAAQAMATAGTDIPLVVGIDSRSNVLQATQAYSGVVAVVPPLNVADELDGDDITDSMQAFLDANPGVEDPGYAGRGWDAIYLLKSAIEFAKSTSGADVRQAIIDMDPYEGTSGTYDFADDNHYGITEDPNYLARLGATSDEIVFSTH